MTRAKNMEASVRQRLLNLSKARGEDFGLILSRFAIERLLYRVATRAESNRIHIPQKKYARAHDNSALPVC